jgi:NIMA-interacting peptidyl-prolyl cis-trans isomerase 1
MSDKEPTLPQGWSRKKSTKRDCFYYINEHTKETQWEEPKEPAQPGKKRKAPEGVDSNSSGGRQVQVLHILRKHAGSRRPSSWRQERITQSKADASEQITGFRNQLMACSSPEDLRSLFRTIAQSESDCSSAKNGGDLGMFSSGQMQKSFEEASFALEVDEMSGLVDSDSGIHIILRVK